MTSKANSGPCACLLLFGDNKDCAMHGVASGYKPEIHISTACEHSPHVWCSKCIPGDFHPGPIAESLPPAPFPPATTGWRCPQCGTCYAPFISQCHRCSPSLDWSRVTCASTSTIASQLAASVMSAMNYKASDHNGMARGIVLTMLQPLNASFDDYFVPLVDAALAEVAAMSTELLPHDEATWTARNGVRVRLKLTEERKPGR